MPWERRGNGRYYYSPSRREGRRVVKDYRGPGEYGELAEAADLAQRQERQERLEAIRADRAAVADLAQHVDDAAQLADVITAAVLLQAGYWKPHRHWRKRNGQKQDAGRCGDRG